MENLIVDVVPLSAQRDVLEAPTEPVAYRQVKLLIVRNGSIRVFADENEIVIHTADAAVLPAETRFRVVPITRAELTCIFIDPEYALDMVYWQYRGYLSDRVEARELADRLYAGVTMIVPLGRNLSVVEPSLDRMVTLSREGDFASNANQMQALWFTIAQAITVGGGKLWNAAPFVPQRRNRFEQQEPIRREVMRVAALLEENPATSWTLKELANRVHLSPNHLAVLCARAWGHTPRTRLQLLRAEHLARLLRETMIPVKQCVRLVGWRNHAHAVKVFRSMYGLSPSHYRIASHTNVA